MSCGLEEGSSEIWKRLDVQLLKNDLEGSMGRMKQALRRHKNSFSNDNQENGEEQQEVNQMVLVPEPVEMDVSVVGIEEDGEPTSDDETAQSFHSTLADLTFSITQNLGEDIGVGFKSIVYDVLGEEEMLQVESLVPAIIEEEEEVIPENDEEDLEMEKDEENQEIDEKIKKEESKENGEENQEKAEDEPQFLKIKFL